MLELTMRRQFLKLFLGLVVLIQMTACTTHYPINNSIISTATVERFSIGDKSGSRSDELLLILTFSGGGTRAAAFAYGVLQTLAETQIIIDGQNRRLLDEVDGISSVSGGSFTAAYYGLFNDRIFEDFETKFLKYNVQSELTKRVFSPFNWRRLASLYFERSDLAAEYYDELLFEKKTFQDFIMANSPLIAINATNVANGSQFTFIGEEFAPICSDLSSFPVSRAVTASSAVPGAFSSIILKNYAGTCNYRLPEWATQALAERHMNTRRYHMAKILSDYQDNKVQPYIHLLDGGISDNLGIRVLINLTNIGGGTWNKLKQLDLENTSKMVIIVVNAQAAMDTSFAKKDYSIPIIDTLGAVSSIPLDRYTFESMEILRNNSTHWKELTTAGRCGEAPPSKNSRQASTSSAIPTCAVQTYLIEVNFDRLQDKTERNHLKHLPTSFYLEPDDVDRLKAAAKKILADSAEFRKLVDDLQ